MGPPWNASADDSDVDVLTEERTETRFAPLYRVLLHNDDVNDMSYVVRSLREVFRFGRMEATAIMLEAHTTGVALCKVEPLEPAEFHRDQLQACGLTSTIEPED